MDPDAQRQVAAAASVDVPVLTSKIVPDAPPAADVVRERLDEVLDGLLTGRSQVVVVSAPAGYGKSSLVSSWVSRRPDVRVAWASLDALDRNPLAFWRDVIASVARVVPDAAEADQVLLERGATGNDHVAALAHVLLADGRPLVLVLDDLHVVDAPAARDGLALLVDRCRDVLRLIAVGRSDPALPLGRWRAEGRSVELRDRDLAFRPGEAAELLARFDLEDVGTEGVERLTERTEGWAVGLLLSALALEGRRDAAAGLEAVLGSDRHLTDYLVDEVLQRLPDDLAAFALELSVLPFFDASLASQVSGRRDAPALLHELVRTNPFVVVISPATYRFHHLLRSLLAAEMRWRDPSRADELLRLGAAAMLARDRTDLAVQMLVDVGDVDGAFDLVVRPVTALSDAGRLRDFARWFSLLPDVEPSTPDRALDYAFALVLAGRLSDAIYWCSRAAEMGAGTDEQLRVTYAATRLVAYGAAGRFDEAAESLDVLEAFGRDVAGSEGLPGRISGQVVRQALEVDDLERAERWLPGTARHPRAAISRVQSPALTAAVLLARGDARGALDLARQASAAVDELGVRPHPAVVDADVALGLALVARLELDEAAIVLEHLAQDSDVLAWPWFRLRTWPLLLQHRAVLEGWPAALELAQSWSTADLPARGGILDQRLRELTARALLGCGRTEAAADLVAGLRAGRRRDLLAARAALLDSRVDDLERMLADRGTWQVPALIESWLLLAQARTGRAAEDALRAALELGAKGGWLAPFELEGRVIDALLARVPLEHLHPELAQWRRRTAAATVSQPPVVRIIEPLTAKEMAVLAHLPSHLTYQAIGSQLYVSVNTVKTYVSAIYRKLGASSRSEAVAIARSAGLLAN